METKSIRGVGKYRHCLCLRVSKLSVVLTNILRAFGKRASDYIRDALAGHLEPPWLLGSRAYPGKSPVRVWKRRDFDSLRLLKVLEKLENNRGRCILPWLSTIGRVKGHAKLSLT